jgi:hypothetical protein
MISQRTQPLTGISSSPKVTAALRRGLQQRRLGHRPEVVAHNFVLHHPIGGTVEAGPEGMVATRHFWAVAGLLAPHSDPHRRGEYVAVLLPTCGHLTGR